jgi:teichoic acid transport system permease protein
MTTAEDAARAGLFRVGGRPTLPAYVAEVWRRRTFIFSMARFKIEAENQQNSLGMLWVVLKPLLNALVYGAVFGFLIGTEGRPEYFIEFLIIGVFIFEFFAQSWTAGGKAITNNAALVQSLAFPRMVLPLAAVTQRFLQFLPPVVIMLIFLIAMGHTPSVEWLLLIPLLALYFVFNAGLALITARLSVHWRDLNNFLPFLTRFFFYTSGIFFSVEHRFGPDARGGGNEWVMRISEWQPVHAFLTLARQSVLDGPYYVMNTNFWFLVTGWSVGLFVIGVVFFWRAEERYGRVD